MSIEHPSRPAPPAASVADPAAPSDRASADSARPDGGARLRVACMVSGRGTTVMNLADRIARDHLPIEIVLVAATKAGVPAIDAAAARGLPTMVIAPDGAASSTQRGAIDDALDRALAEVRPDLIALCGYLRLFRVGAWAGKVINIHPGPLPDFGGKGMYGQRVHRAVLQAGLHETRCCVHLVDDVYDRGPIVSDRRVMVLPADTPESLEARVRQAEFELLPEVLVRIATGAIDLRKIAMRSGRRDLSSQA